MPDAGEHDARGFLGWGSSPLGHMGQPVGSGDMGKGSGLDWAEKETHAPSQCDGDKGDHSHSCTPAAEPARGSTAQSVCARNAFSLSLVESGWFRACVWRRR